MNCCICTIRFCSRRTFERLQQSRYASVISQRGTTDCYREFVVYDRLQAYPEFEVIVTA